jgi:hypothetical protein
MLCGVKTLGEALTIQRLEQIKAIDPGPKTG